MKQWDAFISHASEDKETIVRELSQTLEKFHVKVWYDEFTLKVGDSLSKTIDNGLLNSNYGIIIISKHFLNKKWTDYELRSLISKIENEKKIILPIWHEITQKEIKDFSLYLADIIGIETSKFTIKQIALKLLEVVRPDIFENYRRYFLFKETFKNAVVEEVKMSKIKFQEKPQSQLSQQQKVRVKIIFYGIEQQFNAKTIEESIYNFELDLRPEREIQAFEIMNACYLEFITKNKIIEENIKHDIAKLLLGFSIGQYNEVSNLSDEQQWELYNLYKETEYEY